MRIFIKVIASVCVCTALLTACSSEKYRTDVSCLELCRHAIEDIDERLEYAEYGEQQLKYEFGDGARGANDFCILYSIKVEDINEIGVFLAEDEHKAEEIAEDCREYLEDMRENKRAFISSYAPDQLPKLDKADVRIYGNYVIYTVLDPDIDDTVYEKIKNRLTE